MAYPHVHLSIYSPYTFSTANYHHFSVHVYVKSNHGYTKVCTSVAVTTYEDDSSSLLHEASSNTVEVFYRTTHAHSANSYWLNLAHITRNTNIKKTKKLKQTSLFTTLQASHIIFTEHSVIPIYPSVCLSITFFHRKLVRLFVTCVSSVTWILRLPTVGIWYSYKASSTRPS